MPGAIATSMPPERGLARLLDDLRCGSLQTSRDVARFVARSDVRADDLAPWTAFDHPAEHCYGRKLVATGPGFEVLVMSWRRGDYSAIHDHGQAQCGAVQHFGASDHLVYELAGDCLRMASRERMRPGTITPVDHDLIHQMGNPGLRPMVSLHVYVGSGVGGVTDDARIFDLLERQVQRTNGGVFFSLPDECITAREPGPHGDAPATALHHTLMLAHLRRIHAAGRSSRAQRVRLERLQWELALLGGQR